MVFRASTRNLLSTSSHSNHISSLDGVRGFAVLLVVLFHLWVDFLPGGFLGVSLFFTLSGFVITSSLLREHETTGHIRLRSFWSRRARRLLPASLIVITAATIVWSSQGWMNSHIATDHIFALLQIHNWRIVSDIHYFEIFPTSLGHLWSLSIEMQFYLWAPLVIVISSRWKQFAPFAFATTLAIGVLFTFLYKGHMNQIYGSSLTRWAEIATGCLLALFFQTKAIDARYRHVIDVLAGISVLLILYLSFTLRLFTPFYENGGLIVVSLLSVMILAACTKDTIVRSFFSLAPLRFLGKISYGVYLLHWVLLMWVSRTSLSYSAQRLVVVVSSLLLATISYNYLETPIWRGAVSWKVLMLVTAALSGCVIIICASYL